ncbi:MAG: metalloregulator ArsR/SmtB family transcription factor [Actinomycetota bacterium]
MPRPIYEVKAQYFKTLGHPVRIRVLEVLSGGPHSVSELLPEVGIESSHLSQHLGVLRRAGVVQAERQGSSMIYSAVDPAVFELLKVAKEILLTRTSAAADLRADLDTIDFEAS